VIGVAGARPNYMKGKPVMDALEERGAQVIAVHAGQHYDPARSDVFFDDLGIRMPDHFPDAGSGSHATTLTLRDSTERPITITRGTNRLVRPGYVPDRHCRLRGAGGTAAPTTDAGPGGREARTAHRGRSGR
jgi:UDP-N-acetylglucosamine 2-epimerase